MKGMVITLIVVLWLAGVIVFVWMLPMISIILLGVGLAFFIPAVSRRRRKHV